MRPRIIWRAQGLPGVALRGAVVSWPSTPRLLRVGGHGRGAHPPNRSGRLGARLTKREEPSLNIATYDGHAQKSWASSLLDETQFVSASSDGTLRVWDVAARREVRRVEVAPGAPPLRSLAPLPSATAPPVASILKRDADEAPGDVPCALLRPRARACANPRPPTRPPCARAPTPRGGTRSGGGRGRRGIVGEAAPMDDK